MSELAVAGAMLHVVVLPQSDWNRARQQADRSRARERADPEHGEGRPLVVLHGGPGEAHDCLRPWMDRLAGKERQVVYYDQRGGGRSVLAPGAAPVGWEGHVADVGEVQRHLGVDQIDLLGFSWGALLAILFALEHREQIGKLVLVSPPPTSSGHEAALAANVRRAQDRPEVRAFLDRVGQDKPLARKVAPYFANPERALDLVPVERSDEAAAAVERSLRVLHVGGRLGELQRVPSLVIHGAMDPVPSSATEETATRLAARRVVLEGAGHAPFVEAQDAFVAAVTAFLDGDPT